MFSLQFFDQIRRERGLVANSIYTADADATQLSNSVSSAVYVGQQQFFYRAKQSVARYCQAKLSVRPSDRL